MFESDAKLEKVVEYMRAHWASTVKQEWQVGLDEYPALVKKVVADFAKGASQNRKLFRIAGLSGSGKTTQILPAVEAYCKKNDLMPVLVAARRFVEYHPHYQEILDFYGEAEIRKMTDEFSTIMMFLVLNELMRRGYDIILDVTLLDSEIEKILVEMIDAGGYEAWLLMIATSPKVTDHFLSGRSWRHDAKTEQEFIRATSVALEFYAKACAEMRTIIWSVYDKPPVYDGPAKAVLDVFNEYSKREDLPASDDEARREAKIVYLLEDVI